MSLEVFSKCQAWHATGHREDYRRPFVHFLDCKLVESFYQVNLTVHGKGKDAHLDLFNIGFADSFEHIQKLSCSDEQKDFYRRMLNLLLKMYGLRQEKLDRLKSSLNCLDESKWNELKVEADQYKTKANFDVSFINLYINKFVLF